MIFTLAAPRTKSALPALKISQPAMEERNVHEDYRQPPSIIWFTGVSGVGKSTISQALNAALSLRQRQSCILDGDKLRQGLNRNLGFSPADRAESVRRASEVARILADTGNVVISALISPFAHDRALARALFDDCPFHEVYLHAPLQTLIARDPKGLYRKALAGLINDFSGISADYEVPRDPALSFDTSRTSVDEIVERILAHTGL